jgi:glycerate kinase
MKIILAPDKFKGSLTGAQFCDAVEEGIKMVLPKAHIVKLPLADGGDGTIEILKYHLKGRCIKVVVNNPLFEQIDASYLYIDSMETAFIEMAAASGLALLKPEEQNCFFTSTLGTGQLILDAINRGAKTIMLGIGGSATNDCGIGMATALGYKFEDENGVELIPIGKNLLKIKKINTDNVIPVLKAVTFKVACDVKNVLFGPNGAAYVYGHQKGASKSEIVLLDKGLEHISSLFSKILNLDVSDIEGAGAAGGLGAGAIVFLNAELQSGIDLIKDIVGFDKKIKDADWIITGEGKLDAQTLSGKTIYGVITSAKKYNIPVAALCGSVDISIQTQQQLGLTYVSSIVKDVSDLEQAIKNSYENLVYGAYNFTQLLSKS